MKQIATITMLLLFLWNIPARGDEINPSISYRCDAAEKLFALEAVMETDSPQDKGTIPLKPGFTMLLKSSNTISCKAGKIFVTAKVRIYPGSETGMCGALGSIKLNSLKINGREILEYNELFNNAACTFSEPSLIRVTIKEVKGRPATNYCKGEWDTGVGYYNIQCSEKIR